MRAGVLVVACACGGAVATAPPSRPPPPPPAVVVAKPPAPQVTPEEFCDRFAALKEADCSAFSKIEMSRDDCLGELRAALDDKAAGDFMRSTARCVVGFETCGDVIACLGSLSPDTEHLRACAEDDPARAVGVPRADWERRNGAGVTKFSLAHSTKQAPIEVCTIHAENEWLMSLRCDDGSHAIADHDAAEMARVGNVGKGGRCNSVIDHYRVKCPEASYDVFLDGYVCPLPL